MIQPSGGDDDEIRWWHDDDKYCDDDDQALMLACRVYQGLVIHPSGADLEPILTWDRQKRGDIFWSNSRLPATFGPQSPLMLVQPNFGHFAQSAQTRQRTSPENGFIRSKHSLQVQIQLTNVLKIWKMFDIAQANLTVPVYWWNMIRLQDYQKLFVSCSTLRFSISYRCGRGP